MAAPEALKVAAWLAPDGIPVELLPRPGRRALTRLLVPGPDGTVSISPDLQREIREKHGPADAVLHMRAYLGDDDPARTARCFRLLPHMLAWVGLTRLEDDFPLVLDLLNRATVVLLTAHSGGLALPLIERAARSAARQLEPDDPRLLSVRDSLASAHGQAGAPHRAVRVREQAVEAAAAVLDPDDSRLWSAYANLAVDYQKIGAGEKSLDLAGRVLDRHRRVLGPAHPTSLTAVFNLGAAHRAQGRTGEAVALWRELLADADRELGPGHPVTAQVRRALADQSDDPEAVPDEPAGPITPETIGDWIDHAAGVRLAGNPAVARATLTRVVEQGTADLGPAHPEVIRARRHLALSQQDPGERLATLRAALADADRILGRGHSQTATTSFFLIFELLEQGPPEEYEALLEDRLADLIEVLGFGDPIVRELAVRRSALRLGRPAWWRTGRADEVSS